MKGHHIHYIGKIPYSNIDSDVDKFKSGKNDFIYLDWLYFYSWDKKSSHMPTLKCDGKGLLARCKKREWMEDELTKKVVGLPTCLTADVCHPHG